MKDFSGFIAVIQELIALFEDLIPVEQEKLDAAVKNRASFVEECMRKMEATGDPAAVQTGPARRNDKGVMDGHTRLLSPEHSELYRTVSEKIINRYHPNERDQL